MALTKSTPISWTMAGLSDAVSVDAGFPGCMISLQNLVPDPGSKLWQCRPAAFPLTTFSGFSNPGFISAQLVVGTRVYGMIASSRNPGFDEPFVFDTPSGRFITVTGVTSANVPSSPATTGDWTPPTMALIGGTIIVTHPGFNIGAGNFFGVLNINNPAAPAWSAGTLTGAVTLPARPTAVALYSGRAWYAVGNALVFSDTTSATNCFAGTQVITLGTNQAITAMAGMPLINQTQGGIIQALTVFTSAYSIYQITGDVALSNLALNQLQVETGTYSQNSVCSTPQGVCFVSPEGVRFVAQNGTITDPIGVGGTGLNRIFGYAATPTRIAIAYGGDAIRFNILNNYVTGTILYEFFYHLTRKIWSGPHTFPASLISSFGNSFIISPVGVPGALHRSNVVPTSTDSYVENNARMEWQFVTPLVPPAKDMAMHEVIEQTISMAVNPADDYNFSFVDDQNNIIQATTIAHTTEPSIWGQALWGEVLWGSYTIVYSTFQLAYSQPIVFKQAFFVGSGPSSGAVKIGSIDTRLRGLGYATVLPSVNYYNTSTVYSPDLGYNPASPGFGVGNGYVYGVGYQSGTTWGLGPLPSVVRPNISIPVTTSSESIRAVCMIPAATEWGYAPYETFRDVNTGGLEIIATNNGFGEYAVNLWEGAYASLASRIGSPVCDWQNSINQLQAQLPSSKIVNLYVAWFGNDLRAEYCTLVPGVTYHSTYPASEYPAVWNVAGITRNSAYKVSTYNGGAAYGGTPSDDSVVAAIRDLHSRGLQVAFTPFILMDIPTGNTLPSTTASSGYQPAYPWRGRITKQFSTSDKTSQVSTEVAAFWSQYQAFVLHYANLCAAAGGVEVFLIGSEMRGLTWLRSAELVHPFVNDLVALAVTVQAILPNAKLTYGADWSEWFGFQPADGSGDVDFHLDPLWSSPDIAAIGIDNYFPLSDWRDSLPNVDGQAYSTIYDLQYLAANIHGGEGYDWYYASSTDRANQTRTAITDGAYNEPWVFRPKDMWNWWANQHYNRPAGVQSSTPTAWVPQVKPIWFTEFGIPSVDKGTNQPNVFYDPMSSESVYPYFSTGTADYVVQLAGISAVLSFFDTKNTSFQQSNNPTSSSYLAPMVDVEHIFVYTWDARPFPAFPSYSNTWADAGNYKFDQWIQGKLA
jgi:GTA TIM-barrel-like domain